MSTREAGSLDVRDMAVVHNAFRREFHLLPQLVRNVAPGDTTRAGRIADHYRFLTEVLSHHHTGEDDLLWPKLRSRAGGEALEADVVERMERQHNRLTVLLGRTDALVAAWATGATAEAAERFAQALDELGAELGAHLDDEEQRVLPLVTRHLTAAEWGELGTRGLADTPKARRLVTLGLLLEEPGPDRAAFYAHLPLPARMIHRAVGRRAYRRYTARVRAGATVPGLS